MPLPSLPPSRTETELRALRSEIEGLRRLAAHHRHETRVLNARVLRMTPRRHGWLRYVVKDLETNPRTQYKVHLWGVTYWLANFPLVIGLFFFAPSLWVKLGIFITLVYSIYSNFSTDYGSMSAAMAAFGQAPLPEIPADPLSQPPGNGGQP